MRAIGYIQGKGQAVNKEIVHVRLHIRYAGCVVGIPLSTYTQRR